MKKEKIQLIWDSSVGLIVLAILLVLVGTCTCIIGPFFMSNYRNKKAAKQTACTCNQKQIALTFALYAQENEGIFPPTEDWATTLGARDKLLYCPYYRAGGNSYAYNANVSGIHIEKMGNSADVIFTADSDAKNSIMRGAQDIAFRHGDGRKNIGAIASFVDGHVTYMQKSGLKEVMFKPILKNN